MIKGHFANTSRIADPDFFFPCHVVRFCVNHSVNVPFTNRHTFSNTLVSIREPIIIKLYLFNLNFLSL